MVSATPSGGWLSSSPVAGYAYWLGIGAAVLTAFYSWRLLFLTFHGQPRANERVMAHLHESPPVMMVPLLFLALGAIIGGWLLFDLLVGAGRAQFWGSSLLVLPGHGLPFHGLHARIDELIAHHAAQIRAAAKLGFPVARVQYTATPAVIEAAERFGLSQLHQLRGRVGRGAEESFCILLGDVSPEAAERLDIFVGTEDGFEIAREDLRMRGMGDLFGERQSGVPTFRVADPLRDEALSENHLISMNRTQTGLPTLTLTSVGVSSPVV